MHHVQIGPKAKIIRNVLRDGFTMNELEWNPWVEPGRIGVENHILWAPTKLDPSVGLLLRFPAGAHGDFHEHLGIELMLVLDGVLEHSDGDRYEVGDLVIEEPSSQHQMASTEGCTVLAIRTRPADPRPYPAA